MVGRGVPRKTESSTGYNSKDESSRRRKVKKKKRTLKKQVGALRKGDLKKLKREKTLGDEATTPQLDTPKRKRKADKLGKQGKRMKKRKKRSSEKPKTNLLNCSHCMYSVKVSDEGIPEYWENTIEICTKNDWNAYAHRHFVNLLDDAGYHGKRDEEAVKLASATLKKVNESTESEVPCPYDECKEEFATPIILQDHVVNNHLSSNASTVENDSKSVLQRKNTSVRAKMPRMVRRKDNARLRRGLLPLVPCQTKYETLDMLLPEKLYRIGIVNGTISRNAASYFADERASGTPKRTHGLYECPPAIISCTARSNVAPFGVISIRGGTFSALNFQKQEEDNTDLVAIPIKAPPAPEESPDRPWLLKAWQLMQIIELNSKRDLQLKEAALDDPFKRYGISDESLEDFGRRKLLTEQCPRLIDLMDVLEHYYVEAKVQEIDDKVSEGPIPSFFQSEKDGYYTRTKAKRKSSVSSVDSTSQFSTSTSSSITRRKRSSSMKERERKTPSPEG